MKRFLVALAALLSLFLVGYNNLFAQEDVVLSNQGVSQPGTREGDDISGNPIIADVAVYDLGFFEEDGTLSGGFVLTGKMGQENSIHYGIGVYRDGELIARERLGIVPTLFEGESKKLSFEYNIPKYISGEVTFILVLENESGIPLVFSEITKKKLDGETPNLTCKRGSTFDRVECVSKKDSVLTISFSRMGAYSEESPIGVEAAKAGEEVVISPQLPPGRYFIFVRDEAGEMSPVDIKISGAYGDIMNISVYKKTDGSIEATVPIYGSQLNDSAVSVVLKQKDGRVCTELTQKLITPIFVFPIDPACTEGEIAVVLRSASGQVWDMRTEGYSVRVYGSETQEVPMKSAPTKIVFLMLLAGAAAVLLYMAKNKKSATPLAVLFAALVFGALSPSYVEATTYAPYVYSVARGEYAWNAYTSLTLDQSSYIPGETAVMTGGGHIMPDAGALNGSTGSAYVTYAQDSSNSRPAFDAEATGAWATVASVTGVPYNDPIEYFSATQNFVVPIGMTLGAHSFRFSEGTVGGGCAAPCNGDPADTKLNSPAFTVVAPSCAWNSTAYINGTLPPGAAAIHNSTRCMTPNPGDGTPNPVYCDNVAEAGTQTICCDSGADCYRYTCGCSAPPANTPPTVNAGPNRTITLPTTSTATNASASDSDGTIASYSWTWRSGPATYTIASPAAINTNLTNLTTAGTYVFRLTVTDNLGGISYDEMQVVVNPNPFCSPVGSVYIWNGFNWDDYFFPTWGPPIPNPGGSGAHPQNLGNGIWKSVGAYPGAPNGIGNYLECLGGGAPVPDGTISVSSPSCTIPVGGSTCNGSFTWNIVNATTPNVYNVTRAVQYTTNPSGTNVPYAVTEGPNVVRARDGATSLDSVTVTGNCASGSTWNGTICAATSGVWCFISQQTRSAATCTDPSLLGVPPPATPLPSPCTIGQIEYRCEDDQPGLDVRMRYECRAACGAVPSGSVSVSASSCTIAVGASTCPASFTWTTTNVPSPNLYNATRVLQYSTAASGNNVSYAVTEGINSVQVRNNTTVLDSINVTGDCVAGSFWNGTQCQAVTATLSTAGAPCTIAIGASTCPVSFTWNITGATSPNLYNVTRAIQYSTAASGNNVSYQVTHGANTVRARDASATLSSVVVNGNCITGSFWNGTQCEAITGSVSVAAVSCTIAAGASTCPASFTWTITGATSPNLYNVTTATQYSTAVSGVNISYPVTHGANTVRARDGSTVLDTVTVTGNCAGGTTWGGTSCDANTATANVTPATLTTANSVPFTVTMSSSDSTACRYSRTRDGVAEFTNVPVNGPGNTLPSNTAFNSGPISGWAVTGASDTYVWSFQCQNTFGTWGPTDTAQVTINAPAAAFATVPPAANSTFASNVGVTQTQSGFTVTNTGEAGSTLTVTSITSSNPVFACSGVCTGSIPSGGSQNFDFSFTPTIVGPDASNITFVTNVGNVVRTVSGTGYNPISASFNFGRVPSGKVKVRNDITITNNGVVTIPGGTFTLQSPYTCDDGTGTFVASCAYAAIAPGGSVTFTVQFAPPLPAAYNGRTGTFSGYPSSPVLFNGSGVLANFQYQEN